MHGTNPIHRQELGSGQQLWVQEVFATIQGEGPLSGTPCVFVRLAGCHLKCHFCDTDFSSSTWKPGLEEVVAKVIELNRNRSDLVVLTGGEPMRQNIIPLIAALNSSGIRVQIETAGNLMLPELEKLFLLYGAIGGENTIVCSPKTQKLHDDLVPFIHAYKYIVRKGETSPTDGLPEMSTQVKNLAAFIARPPRNVQKRDIYLQPCEEYKEVDGRLVSDEAASRANVELARDLCLKFGYRLSLQTHKMLDLP